MFRERYHGLTVSQGRGPHWDLRSNVENIFSPIKRNGGGQTIHQRPRISGERGNHDRRAIK